MDTNQIILANKPKSTTADQLLKVLQEIIPGVTLDETDSGEVIIRTGLMMTGRGTFEAWQEM